MSTLLLRHGRVIDPSRNFDATADLWLADGVIVGAGPQTWKPDTTLDCTGLIVIDRYSPSMRRCLICEDSSQGRLSLE